MGLEADQPDRDRVSSDQGLLIGRSGPLVRSRTTKREKGSESFLAFLDHCEEETLFRNSLIHPNIENGRDAVSRVLFRRE